MEVVLRLIPDSRRLACLLLLIVGCASPAKLTAPAAPKFEASAYRYGNTIEVGDVDPETMAAAYRALANSVDGGAKRVTFRINSMGGEIFLGLKWIQMVTDLKKLHHVQATCIVDGAAYSMAAVILESPVCDLRLATPSSTILFHNGKGTGEGTVEGLEQAAHMLEVMNQALAALVADRMHMSPAEYRAHIQGKDWVMATAEALLNHVIDGMAASAEIAPPAPVEG
jgi:ATP-dependent protease ClpP protease subunit